MAGINSCYGCKKRFVGCHSQCETYLKWKKEYEKQKDLINSCYRNKNAGYYHK